MFASALDRQIDIAETSVSIVVGELTSNVMQSQRAIFSATDQFITLNENALSATDCIQSMRSQVLNVRERTLNPILIVLGHIRDLRRDAKTATVLHFAQSLAQIYDVLQSGDLIWSAHTLTHALEFISRNDEVYEMVMLQKFIGIEFRPFPTIVSPIPISLKVGDLKRLSCILEILSEIESFPKTLMQKIDGRLVAVASNFQPAEYSILVVAYCIVHDDPPIPRVLFTHFSNVIRQQSLAYFETQSNDLQTLFRFMESSWSILSSFRMFLEFHSNNETFVSIIGELPSTIDLLLLDKLPSDRFVCNRVQKLAAGFQMYCDQLTHVAESNVLQFLSRLNCISLDALSFIRLTRALKTFNDFLNCAGLSDWISLTANEFFSRYSSVAFISIKSAIANDSWVPLPVESDFIALVQTMPSDTSVFTSGSDFDPGRAYASSSAVAAVRILHSLICLSFELDSEMCFNLIVQVSSYVIFCVLNAFCSPIPFFEGTRLNRKLVRYFEPQFSGALTQLMKFQQALPDQKPPETRAPALLIEMITGTEGFALLKWYLRGIRQSVESRMEVDLTAFFDTVLNIVLPSARSNLSGFNARHFLPLKKLKLELIAAVWIISDVQFEHHEFIAIASKGFQRLDQSLNTIQVSQAVAAEIWRGSWLYVRAILLSGFGSVRSCNAFGRSLMVGDTRAVSTSFVRFGKVEIDTTPILEFINAFFYKPIEFAAWIDTAIRRYKPAHLANLVRTGLNGKLSAKDSKDLLAKIDALVGSL
jgi:hypothetical protein